jgi:gliding motility-associated lipoprotein GldH
MRASILIIAILLLLPAVSCDSGTVFDQYEHTENGLWGWQDPIEFRVDISDTLAMNNIYLQIRHTVEYPFSNLYLFVHVKSPTGQQITDTINMVLAAPDGKWTGRGNGNIRELMLLYRRQTQFRTPGTYVFTLEQAMRLPELPVTDLGIRIERIKP